MRNSSKIVIKSIDSVHDVLFVVIDHALETFHTPSELQRMDGRKLRQRKVQSLANLLKYFHRDAWCEGYEAANNNYKKASAK